LVAPTSIRRRPHNGVPTAALQAKRLGAISSMSRRRWASPQTLHRLHEVGDAVNVGGQGRYVVMVSPSVALARWCLVPSLLRAYVVGLSHRQGGRVLNAAAEVVT
jgi:hypothetical protein